MTRNRTVHAPAVRAPHLAPVKAMCVNHPRYKAGCAPCRRHAARYQSIRRMYGNREYPSTGTVRRVRGLAVQAWPARVIGEKTGLTLRQIQHIQRGTSPVVQLATLQAITRFADQVGRRTGPSPRSATIALRNGWSPITAWLDIDDPDETPDPGWKPTPVDPQEIVFLADAGETWHGIERRLGVQRHSLQKVLNAAGLPHIGHRLNVYTDGPGNVITKSEATKKAAA